MSRSPRPHSYWAYVTGRCASAVGVQGLDAGAIIRCFCGSRNSELVFDRRRWLISNGRGLPSEAL